MLEVGRIKLSDPKQEFHWNRAHFGAVRSRVRVRAHFDVVRASSWAWMMPCSLITRRLFLLQWVVVSAPLILGLDITASANTAPYIDVITNAEAIKVSQTWAGHPGTLVWSQLEPGVGFVEPEVCDASKPAQKGWALQTPAGLGGKVLVKAPGGGCLSAPNIKTTPCNQSDLSQQFEWNAASKQLQQNGRCVDVHNGYMVWMYGCSNTSGNDQLVFGQDGTLSSNAGAKCLAVVDKDPAGATFQSSLQAWAKPLGKDKAALLLINPTASPQQFAVPLASVFNFTATEAAGAQKSYAVRDVWARADGTPATAPSYDLTVGPMDSAFVTLTAQ